jgi:hypothetical protein
VLIPIITRAAAALCHMRCVAERLKSSCLLPSSPTTAQYYHYNAPLGSRISEKAQNRGQGWVHNTVHTYFVHVCTLLLRMCVHGTRVPRAVGTSKSLIFPSCCRGFFSPSTDPCGSEPPRSISDKTCSRLVAGPYLAQIWAKISQLGLIPLAALNMDATLSHVASPRMGEDGTIVALKGVVPRHFLVQQRGACSSSVSQAMELCW